MSRFFTDSLQWSSHPWSPPTAPTGLWHSVLGIPATAPGWGRLDVHPRDWRPVLLVRSATRQED